MALYIGVMSGTSLDGIDVAIVNIDAHAISLKAAETFPFNDSLRKDLLKLINAGRAHLQQLGQIDMALGYAYSDAINQLLTETHIPADDIEAVGCHGQTVYHAPDAAYPFSMQIGNAHVIAEKTGIDTVADFRQHDMILGGQGAPLVPAFHQALFQHSERNRVIANIGGIGNITVLPVGNADAVTGFDTGPGNVLLDQWYQQHHNDLYDDNGQWARDGEVDPALLNLLMNDPFFFQAAPKSTGREYFNLNWLTQKLAELDKPIKAKAVQKTLLQMTANSMSGAIRQYADSTDEVYVCGGGAHNEVLMQALRDSLPGMKVETTADLGLAPDWVEACAFAWLARQYMHHQPGNLPSVTGARKATLLGALYSSSAAS
ncbi:anhydro-N-acetylmuramic acid kinase [Methylophaga sp. OBS1]|jgi:anhydro-N-acetylmuramic acid kinase|uniref:anhydro-N-acetylmuramic acid kinase n=1 Tax=Methylophaga sp. OBS1 TaxID=2991933 RepID=UPI00225B4B7B|nr:anhydro-N-acetylmuramic acid kinase [Methylophaga sp. OBS1]MCX4192703.1 anhydro-N-acetylmuramic acid kinase [Methylophaga sp. OBS1]